ncbi:hypothetical protein [uncultured Polaribacter sp.]|uniref:hypothetical protein n=1 Tax=uncultured Polaribacter sp. TaxID=174711 RepID=UPI00262B1175|nr:hypothetical protein [uncultured Polaribacter sp.]
MSKEKKAQHREFVQSVITRMNANSFQIKGLMITLVAAFLGIYASNSNITFIIIPLPIVLLFWFLDAYYLQLERKFRGIYNDICDLNTDQKKTTKIFEMNPTLYSGKKFNYWDVFFKSPAISPLYLSVIIGLIILYFYIKCSCH